MNTSSLHTRTVSNTKSEITLDAPNSVTMKAISDAKNGIDIHGPFNSVAELMEDLNA